MVIDWRLCLLVAAGVAVCRAIQGLLARRLRRFGHAVVATNHALGERMIQIVAAIRPIKLFGQEARELEQFRKDSEAVRVSMYRADAASAWSMPVIEIVVLAIVLGVLQAADAWRVSLPTLIAFLVLLYRLQNPLLLISQLNLRLAALRGSIDAVEWLLAQPPARGPRRVAAQAERVAPDFTQTLRFDDVGYAYEGKSAHPALHAISFRLEPGSMTALVGRSGAGKSTIVNLLCGLIEPTSGRILLGDTDIALIDPADWRRHIALAGQDLELVNATVADNIAYGVGPVDRAAVEEASRLAEADGFIRQLPNGYDTVLGASGFGLSGGQRQRIGLARALLRKPQILILDEATSAVDGVSEDIIIRLLRDRRSFDRAVIISHRLEMLEGCDACIELADGRVRSTGRLEDTDWFRTAFLRSGHRAPSPAAIAP
jgi:subfamily B ATP-binding cassette protein MsbA